MGVHVASSGGVLFGSFVHSKTKQGAQHPDSKQYRFEGSQHATSIKGVSRVAEMPMRMSHMRTAILPRCQPNEKQTNGSYFQENSKLRGIEESNTH
jgi:hypothetical protein